MTMHNGLQDFKVTSQNISQSKLQGHIFCPMFSEQPKYYCLFFPLALIRNKMRLRVSF